MIGYEEYLANFRLVGTFSEYCVCQCISMSKLNNSSNVMCSMWLKPVHGGRLNSSSKPVVNKINLSASKPYLRKFDAENSRSQICSVHIDAFINPSLLSILVYTQWCGSMQLCMHCIYFLLVHCLLILNVWWNLVIPIFALFSCLCHCVKWLWHHVNVKVVKLFIVSCQQEMMFNCLHRN